MASYDLLIIGAGPAAWSCAMTARQRGLTTAVACAQSATSWLQRAERIDNYPGLPQISGKELLSRFRAQAADMGVIIIEQLARQIMPSGDIYMTLVGNDISIQPEAYLPQGTVATEDACGGRCYDK